MDVFTCCLGRVVDLGILEMSEPSVEETVADLAGRYIDDAWLSVRVDALIADWRKRGEAAEAMRAKIEAKLHDLAEGRSGPGGERDGIIRCIDAIFALKGNGEGK